MLKKLKLNRINFEKDCTQLEILVDAVSRNQSIESIDLSCNDLSDRYGNIVSQFVQSQIELREEQQWRESLRVGRKPYITAINRGITELILHDNNLGKSFIESLSMRIRYDDVLRFVDLRYNNLNSQLLLKMLKTICRNKILVGLDVRGNKGYNDNVGVQRTLSQFL